MTDIDRDFGGDDAEMSVHEKTHPTLGPTEGSQDVDSLPRHIVPMGAYNDPNNPVAVSGSVNLALDDHPVTHDPDYGKQLHEVYGQDHVEGTMTEGAKTLAQFDQTGAGGDAGEDRSEWLKADWQAAAKSHGLPTSGNVATLRERVEAHEAEAALTPEEREAQEREEEVEAAKNLNAGDWQSQIAEASDAEALGKLRSLYDESGADFKTVAKAFDDRQAEVNES